jgi:hypothetical protein
MVTIKNGQDQGFHTASTGQYVLGMRRDDRVNEPCHFQFAEHSQHQGQMGHGRKAVDRNCHDEPPRDVLEWGAS